MATRMSQWIVIDYSDVVVHIFHAQKRAFYSLEDLWSDAPRLALPEPAAPRAFSAKWNCSSKVRSFVPIAEKHTER